LPHEHLPPNNEKNSRTMKRTSKKRSTLEILGISGVNNYTKIWIPSFCKKQEESVMMFTGTQET
jgi:hypothetical protein